MRVLAGTTVIDLVTYPRVTNLGTATSLTFPSDCKPANRTDFARYGRDLAARVKAWDTAVAESQRLCDEFAAWVAGSEPAAVVEPL